ncbi:DUF3709 domain-containing protein, partial [Vibrio cholerae]|nr:DUF3709 domain-containing protein [Vibrio cholerae]
RCLMKQQCVWRCKF